MKTVNIDQNPIFKIWEKKIKNPAKLCRYTERTLRHRWIECHGLCHGHYLRVDLTIGVADRGEKRGWQPVKPRRHHPCGCVVSGRELFAILAASSVGFDLMHSTRWASSKYTETLIHLLNTHTPL
jgi:hypothetical protein